MTEYSKDARVKHPDHPEWGLGQVLSDSAGGRVRVFFIDAGEKKLMLNHASLVKVEGDEAKSLFLDNLAVEKEGKVKRFRSLTDAMDSFNQLFPEGFHEGDFDEWERDYKVQGHKLMLEILDKSDFAKLLDKENYQEICDRAMRVVNKLNLIFPNEKMALKDGLKLERNQQLFAKKLYTLLYSEGEVKRRFDEFASCLAKLGAAKWPIVSYFQFIRYPERYMFVKPLVTQNAASILGFEINYQSELNWQTYDSVQKLAEYLKGRLDEMKPRDMIDIQTFMWCIDPAVFEEYLKERKADEKRSD
ncbi:MAG: DUF3553 domain-containing protein [Mariprofundaceae bacterium]|nr:DUF3553 domain-containing protein [Mariprofundaceae bacterium]